MKSTFLKGRVLCAPLDTSNAKPLHFSAGELKRYVASYNSVPVRGLRAAFDAYRAGKADTATAQSLRPYGTALFADRFRLFTITGNMGDGYVLRVQFRHHPEVVYLAALVFIKDKTPSIPVFESGPCSVAEQKWISTTYSQPLALGDDGSLTNPPTTHAPR